MEYTIVQLPKPEVKKPPLDVTGFFTFSFSSALKTISPWGSGEEHSSMETLGFDDAFGDGVTEEKEEEEEPEEVEEEEIDTSSSDEEDDIPEEDAEGKKLTLEKKLEKIAKSKKDLINEAVMSKKRTDLDEEHISDMLTKLALDVGVIHLKYNEIPTAINPENVYLPQIVVGLPVKVDFEQVLELRGEAVLKMVIPLKQFIKEALKAYFTTREIDLKSNYNDIKARSVSVRLKSAETNFPGTLELSIGSRGPWKKLIPTKQVKLFRVSKLITEEDGVIKAGDMNYKKSMLPGGFLFIPKEMSPLIIHKYLLPLSWYYYLHNYQPEHIAMIEKKPIKVGDKQFYKVRKTVVNRLLVATAEAMVTTKPDYRSNGSEEYYMFTNDEWSAISLLGANILQEEDIGQLTLQLMPCGYESWQSFFSDESWKQIMQWRKRMTERDKEYKQRLKAARDGGIEHLMIDLQQNNTKAEAVEDAEVNENSVRMMVTVDLTFNFVLTDLNSMLERR